MVVNDARPPTLTLQSKRAAMAHCVIEDVTDDWDPEAWDKPLGDMLIKCHANPQKFLETVLGFLKRKSNFFKEPEPKKRVLDAFKEVGPRPALGFRRCPQITCPAASQQHPALPAQVSGEAEGGLKGGFLGAKPAAKVGGGS